MLTGITFCWTRQSFNTTFIGPDAFEGRELCALVLHSAGPDSYLTLLRLALWCLKDGVMFTGITFCWNRQLFNTTSIGPVAFEGRELCALVLHSAGPDIYLALF
jgi:hypothetical protein